MSGSSKETDGDIQTDAHMEPDEDEGVFSIQIPSSSAQANQRQPSKPAMSKLDTSTLPRHLAYAQTARPIASSDGRVHLRYLSHMPPNLQEDNCEILIINSDNDLKAAQQFQKHLKKEILFNVNNQLRTPRVKLLHEIIYEAINNLDLAFSKALYVFLYVTPYFCEQLETLLWGQACLTEAINDPHKKWCIVPVHTASKKNQRYKLPMMLNCLRSIHYWSGSQDQFYVDSIRKLLDSKAGLILERDRLLDDDRQNYYIKNKSDILKNAMFPNDSKLFKCSSLPVMSSTKGNEDSSKVFAQDSSKKFSSICFTDVYTYDSLPEQQNKALPEETVSNLVEQMEEIVISQENPILQNNSQARESQRVLQQSLSASVHLRSHGHEHLQHQATAAAISNINNNSESNEQSVSEISTSREPYSSIVVDGPVDDENSLSPTNPGFRVCQDRISPNPPSATAVHVSSYAPVNTMQGPHTGIPTFHNSSMNPTAYNFPSQGAYVIDNFGRPMFLPPPYYQEMSAQHYPPIYPYNPNLYQPIHQHPSMPPFNMQQLYSYANPIPQNPYIHNAMRSNSHISEPASYANSQVSTEMNAPNSVRANLPYSSLTGAFSTFGSLPGTNHWGLPQFPSWSNTPIHHPASAPLTRPQGQSLPTVPQQAQSHNPLSNEQETPHEPQSGSVRTVPRSNTQPIVKSAQTTIAATMETANPVIQYIHHHHHEKKITVASATNVLIGDRSTFVNKHKSSEAVASDDESSEDGSETPNDGNVIADSARLEGSGSGTSRSDVACSAAEPAVNVPDATGSGSAASDPNVQAEIGFAECLNPANTRKPVEGSDTSFLSAVDEVNQTDCKKMC